MRILEPLRRSRFGWRVATLTLLSGLVVLALNSRGASSWLQAQLSRRIPGLVPGQLAYLAFVLRTLLVGLSLMALVWLVVKLERPAQPRQFFKLGRLDWPGLGLVVLLIGVLNVLEAVFLRSWVYEPIRLFLIAHGVPGTPAGDLGFAPDPALAGVNLLLAILIVWVEAPEEVFFRGYVQNHLQERIGPNAALVASALLWDAWHLTDPAGFVRRLAFGLAFGLVFRLRQNTTPLAVAHPLANRLLLVYSLIAPRT